MKVSGHYGTVQFPSVGLRQGCPLSATLFGLFLDGLHEHMQTSVPGAGIKVQHLRLTDMEYADDVFLLGNSASELQDLINAMSNYCEALHTQISAPKTKVVVLRGHRNHCLVPQTHIFFFQFREGV